MMSELIETDLTIADNINYLMDAMAKPEVTKEEVHAFLNAHRSIDRIVKIEGDYNDNKMSVFYRDEQGRRHVRKEDFYPFLWCKQSAARQFFKGDRKLLISKMDSYGISCKGLRVHDTEGNIHPRMENGYRVMFFARVPMSYTHFLEFFSDAGRPVFPKQSDPNFGQREYITVAPVEQFMIATGYRMFKGYNDYDELKRLIFDLETEGLEADKHRISQIGVRTNKGFEKIIKIEGEGQEKNDNELCGIDEFFDIIRQEEPDIIAGYNSENFDFPFFDIALQKRHKSSLSDFTNPKFGGKGFFKSKKQKVLKLGGEMEYYYPTIFYGHNITDGLFAVRRAQAIDSNMKEAGLKYVTKYSKINKPNRVYLPGKIINQTWSVKECVYAFCDEDGSWFQMTDALLNKTYTAKENDTEITRPKYILSEDGERLFDAEKNKTYVFVSGEYIGERYLKDDLWETDKIEYRYNQGNFIVCKMLPVQFDKMCTMGTAAIWKYMMLSWSYEHDLAIPELIDTKPFTGGLSRLLKVGYVNNVIKADYNSLYPSILLTFNINSPIDVMGAMLAMLEYMLSQREYHKGLKSKYGKESERIKELLRNEKDVNKIAELTNQLSYADAQRAYNDSLQLGLKIISNAFFGSYGSGQPFPHSDLVCAEQTTCTGRMMLRLMIKRLSDLGYTPIVGDSFTGDTPLFIKYDVSGDISIKPISEIFDSNKSSMDILGREYDTSYKGFKVLCRSGWVEPTYVYRHKTNKPIYKVIDEDMEVDVTEDHSLFNIKQEKIKPSEITESTKLEYYQGNIVSNKYHLDRDDMTSAVSTYIEDATIPDIILNADIESKKNFLKNISRITIETPNKTLLAAILYLKNSIISKKP